MSWYAQMMKSTEMARARNQRMERRLRYERHGPQFVEQTTLASLDREKRMIEKELERIRKGIHRPPKLKEALTNRDGPLITMTPRATMTDQSTVLDSTFLTKSIDPEYSSEENKLYDAIVFLQHNPSALVPILTAHAQSDAYLETLERVTEQKDAATSSFVPRFLHEDTSKSKKVDLVNKYTALLQRNSPVLRRESPLMRISRKRESPRVGQESPLLQDTSGRVSHRSVPSVLPPIDRKSVTDGETGADSEPETQRSGQWELVRTRSRKGLVKKSSFKRNTNTTHFAKLASSDVNSDAMQGTRDVTESRQNDDKKARQGKATGGLATIETDMYNADGSLRTVHQMPSADTAWEEAQKARYIRTKEQMERDKELTVNQIFEKPTA